MCKSGVQTRVNSGSVVGEEGHQDRVGFLDSGSLSTKRSEHGFRQVTQSWLNIFTSVERGDVFHSMEAPKSIQCVMKQSLEVGFLASTIVTWDFETIFCKTSLRRELICRSKHCFMTN